jgi:FkbM family methyltransferase
MNIIQIGCNDGKDHVFDFVKENIDNINKLILIDANKNCIDYCKNIQYKNISKAEFLFCAITNNNDEHVILYTNDNDNFGRSPHASLSNQHVINHLHTEIARYKVPAKNINKLFEDLNFKTIDRLYIDVEGLDVDLINAINFENFDIKFLLFESQHSDGVHSGGGPRLRSCVNRLIEFGYNVTYEGMNTIAIKNN